MKQAILTALATTLVACAHSPHEELIGFWRSNEAKTLESMHATPSVTKEAKQFLEDGFFGHYVVEFRKDTYRALSEIEEENIEEFYKYYPYKIVEKGEDYYLIESYSLLLEENEIRKIYMEGDCYYSLISKWDFRDYYCRMKQ